MITSGVAVTCGVQLKRARMIKHRIAVSPKKCVMVFGMEMLLLGVWLSLRLRRFYVKCNSFGFCTWPIWIKKLCFQTIRIIEFATDVHGEFQFPAHGLDHTRGSDLIAVGIGENRFDMWSLLKGTDLDVDAQTIPIRVRFGTETENLRLFRSHSIEAVFGEEEIHLVIITKTKLPAFL